MFYGVLLSPTWPPSAGRECLPPASACSLWAEEHPSLGAGWGQFQKTLALAIIWTSMAPENDGLVASGHLGILRRTVAATESTCGELHRWELPPQNAVWEKAVTTRRPEHARENARAVFWDRSLPWKWTNKCSYSPLMSPPTMDKEPSAQ